MKLTVKSIGEYVFNVTTIVLSLSLISLPIKAQKALNKFIVNDEVVADATIKQLEDAYRIKCIPGTYWYDRLTGAYGIQGGPCIGIGDAGLQIGGPLKSNASAGNTGVFINGRELHPMDVQGLQTFLWVIPGRYWMDANGYFGYENYPVALGNLYQLYWSKNGSNGNSGKPPETGDIGGLWSDGTNSGIFVKKADGSTIEY